MPTPSLLIVPARFKTGTLYSQIPVPVAPSTSSVGDFTVTRNTAARRFDSAGLVASVASGIPRLDYYTSGGVTGCPALLVEPAGTNLLLQSEAWNVSPWAATSGSQGATVSGNVTTSPDGTTNADKLIEAAVTGSHFCLQSLTLTSGTTYTASFFAKASERTLGRLRMLGSGAYWDIDFDLTLGTATGGTNPFIQNYGNGWYRIGGTFTANQASNNFILSLRDASGNSSYTGNGTNGFFVYGAQIETGSVATSYIPTTAGTGSRSADVISVTGAVSGSIGQTEGTIYMEVAVYSTNKELFSISSGGVNGEAIRIQTNSDGKLGAIALVSNSQVITTSSINALNLGQFYKVAFAYKLNDYTLYIDGVVQTLTDVTGGVPVNMNKLVFARPNDSFVQDQRVRALALYNTRLTNDELQALTA